MRGASARRVRGGVWRARRGGVPHRRVSGPTPRKLYSHAHAGPPARRAAARRRRRRNGSEGAERAMRPAPTRRPAGGAGAGALARQTDFSFFIFQNMLLAKIFLM